MSFAQLRPVFCSTLCWSFASSASCAGNFCSSESTAFHCDDERSVSTATNATESEGAIAAPAPRLEPEPAPDDPPQPASANTVAVTAATPRIPRARIVTPLSAGGP